MRIDLQAISPSPILLYYWDSPDSAAYFSRLQNEAIQEVVEAHPQRFADLGTVPLQSVREAIAIAEEAKRLGLTGLEIGTSVDGKQLADAEFESFYEAVQGLDLLLFIHPIEGGDQDRRDPFAGILNNVVSFPYHTTIAVVWTTFASRPLRTNISAGTPEFAATLLPRSFSEIRREIGGGIVSFEIFFTKRSDPKTAPHLRGAIRPGNSPALLPG